MPTTCGVAHRICACHEWFGTDDGREWAAPTSAIADVLRRALRAGLVGRVVWIGRRVFPYPVFVEQHLLAASVFVDTPHRDARIWACDAALRLAAPVAVVVDGEGFSLAQSRRLQLAAAAGRGIGLIARPSRDETELSAATTRWRVESEPSPGVSPRWRLTLIRNKDDPSLTDEHRTWVMEWHDAEGLVVVPAVVEGGARVAPPHTT